MDRITCPACERTYEIDETYYGRSMRCHCGTIIAVATPVAVPPLPPRQPRIDLGGPPKTARDRQRERYDRATSPEAIARRKPFTIAALVMLVVVTASAFTPWFGLPAAGIGLSPLTMARLVPRISDLAAPVINEEGMVALVLMALASWGYMAGAAFVVIGAVRAMMGTWESAMLTGGFAICFISWGLWLVLWAMVAEHIPPEAEAGVAIAQAMGVGFTTYYYVAGACAVGGIIAAGMAQSAVVPSRRGSRAL